MKIIEINNYSGFLSLEDEWCEVFRRSDNTIFSSWEWLSIWWKHFGGDKKLILLLAEDHGELIGIAPLMYSVHKMFGLRRGKIEFIGTSDSDYTDFIIANEGDECIKLFVNHLFTTYKTCDCIDLLDIPGCSVAIPYLDKIAETIQPIHKCPYTQLPTSYEIFLNALKRKPRRELQRSLRRLEEDFKVEFVNSSRAPLVEQGMNSFFELHQKRWAPRGFPGVFANQRIRDFHLDIAKSFSHKGWLGLFQLRLSGFPAAALYGFKYKYRYYAYLSGFDPKYFPYSIGNMMFSYAIADCIKEGFAEFDFMRGAEEYKNRWNTIERWNQHAVLIRNGLRAKVENWLFKEYWHQGNRIQYVLKMKK